MEFHDILHGHIRISDEDLIPLFKELLNSPEIHRLRNMRQMNFDVPLIQELGRSRRLPHSIGVVNLAVQLAHKAKLDASASKIILSAALLHDAAIPPYGHLVEAEFKRTNPEFDHAKILSQLINGDLSERNQYQPIVGDMPLQLSNIFQRYNVDPEKILKLVCPKPGEHSCISADIDLDNIDNVHRMAAMLGWEGAKANMALLADAMKLKQGHAIAFEERALPAIQQWMEYRQRIYTLIIAHPECIPYNALQADLVRAAVDNSIITADAWWLTEPEFEEALRSRPETKLLARQLIDGCNYQFIDYVWIKNFRLNKKIANSEIVDQISSVVDPRMGDSGYFVWNEKSLITRKIDVSVGDRKISLGENSSSCMIALVKRTLGRPKRTKDDIYRWRSEVVSAFAKIFNVEFFDIDFPESYNGRFNGVGMNELQLGYN